MNEVNRARRMTSAFPVMEKNYCGPDERNPAAGLADRLSLRGSLDNIDRENSDSPLHVQDTIADLQRDYVVEALRIPALKASHAADDIGIRDDDCAEHSIRIAIRNLREAATGFRQLKALNAAIAGLAGEP